jgi:hypothetical protein
MSTAQFFLLLATIHIVRLVPAKASFWLANLFMVVAAVSTWRAQS